MTHHDAAFRGVFVTGTDTGVGKTLVACEIVRRLRAQSLAPGVIKPIETGVGPEGPLDALALRAAAASNMPLEWVCPQQFALPAAPNVAAEAEGRKVDLDAIDTAMTRVMEQHECVIAEGAGGLLVPLGECTTMADLAARYDFPLVVVCRAALGTLNHTRLTLEAAAARGLEVLGLVISHGSEAISDADAANLEDLRQNPGARVLGEIPPLAPGDAVPGPALDVEPLLRALGGRRG